MRSEYSAVQQRVRCVSCVHAPPQTTYFLVLFCIYRSLFLFFFLFVSLSLTDFVSFAFSPTQMVWYFIRLISDMQYEIFSANFDRSCHFLLEMFSLELSCMLYIYGNNKRIIRKLTHSSTVVYRMWPIWLWSTLTWTHSSAHLCSSVFLYDSRCWRKKSQFSIPSFPAFLPQTFSRLASIVAITFCYGPFSIGIDNSVTSNCYNKSVSIWQQLEPW